MNLYRIEHEGDCISLTGAETPEEAVEEAVFGLGIQPARCEAVEVFHYRVVLENLITIDVAAENAGEAMVKSVNLAGFRSLDEFFGDGRSIRVTKGD